jgi:hypothetical protein
MQTAAEHPADVLAAATEAARLARDKGTDARQRWRPGGGLDVVLFEKGRLQVYRVDADGRSVLCKTHPRIRRHFWFPRALVVGAALVVGGFFVSAFIPAATYVGVGALVALLFIPGLMGNFAIEDGLKAARWEGGEWQFVPQVSGPPLAATAQLQTAEALAKTHDSQAFARLLPDRVAEVVATSGGRLYRYQVDTTGAAVLVERSPVRARYNAAVFFSITAISAFVCIFVGAFAFHVHDGRIPVLFGVMFASFLTATALFVDRRAERIARPKEEWLEIDVPEPPTD